MATPTIRIALHGDKQILARLKGVIPRLRKKALMKAARIAMKPLHAKARSSAPKGETGQLRKSIKLKAMKKNRRGVVGIAVATSDGFFQGKTFYGGFQEFGWHSGKRTTAIRNKTVPDDRKWNEGKHFIEQAYQGGKEQAARTFNSELSAQLDFIAKGG